MYIKDKSDFNAVVSNVKLELENIIKEKVKLGRLYQQVAQLCGFNSHAHLLSSLPCDIYLLSFEVQPKIQQEDVSVALFHHNLRNTLASIINTKPLPPKEALKLLESGHRTTAQRLHKCQSVDEIIENYLKEGLFEYAMVFITSNSYFDEYTQLLNAIEVNATNIILYIVQNNYISEGDIVKCFKKACDNYDTRPIETLLSARWYIHEYSKKELLTTYTLGLLLHITNKQQEPEKTKTLVDYWEQTTSKTKLNRREISEAAYLACRSALDHDNAEIALSHIIRIHPSRKRFKDLLALAIGKLPDATFEQQIKGVRKLLTPNTTTPKKPKATVTSIAFETAIKSKLWKERFDLLLSLDNNIQNALQATANYTRDILDIFHKMRPATENKYNDIYNYLVAHNFDFNDTIPTSQNTSSRGGLRRAITFGRTPVNSIVEALLSFNSETKETAFAIYKKLNNESNLALNETHKFILIKTDMIAELSRDNNPIPYPFCDELLPMLTTPKYIWHCTIQIGYIGNGRLLKKLGEDVDPFLLLNQLPRTNKLAKCDHRTPDNELIPLLIKAAQSRQLARSSIACTLLSYFDIERVKKHTTEADLKIVNEIANLTYKCNMACLVD
tara:strand:- start:32834 stop:34678 length:1845 start_codon:yes stop_codon:yes gene_type:complete